MRKNYFERHRIQLRICLLLPLLAASLLTFAQVTKTVGGAGGADYQTLGSAFSAINSGTLSGNVTLQLISSTTESAAATLNNSATLTSLLIYPTQSGLSVTGNGAYAVIALNGADNVTIDGRVNAIGTTASLTIENTSTGTTGSNRAIFFDNDATGNTIKYCVLKSANVGNNWFSSPPGIVGFGRNAPLTGNDNNRIANCKFTNTQGNRPLYTIYSEGSPQANKENSGNEIVDNEFVDCLNTGVGNHAIVVSISNYNAGWKIIGNHFYETTAQTVSASSMTISAINVNCINGNCGGFDFSGNFIGGRERNCGGSPMAVTNSGTLEFNGIIVVSNTAQTNGINLQGNRIANIDWSGTEVSFTAISATAQSNMYVGNLTGNVIGSDSLAGSIKINATTSFNRFSGLRMATNSADVVDTLLIANNKIGGIELRTSTPGNVNIWGILGGGNNLKIRNIIIRDNQLGSTSISNSILLDASVTGASKMIEAIVVSNSGSNAITGNLVANITNTDKTNSIASRTVGITSLLGSHTINNNQIYELAHAGKNFSSSQGAVLQGIMLAQISGSCSIVGNTVRDLRGLAPDFGGHVYGINVSNGTGNSLELHNNYVYGLHAPAGASSATGIRLDGNSPVTMTNNLIRVGNESVVNTYGLFSLLSTTASLNMYHNTLVVSGNLAAGDAGVSAACLYQSNLPYICSNNIFVNTRSTPGAVDKHYAIHIQTNESSNLTINYNNYFVSGEGGTVARFWSTNYRTFNCWRTSSFGQNAASTNDNPAFANPAGTAVSDFVPTVPTLAGVAGTGVTLDLLGNSRSQTNPAMGALAYTVAPGADIVVEYPSCTDLVDSVSTVAFGSQTTGAFVDRVLKIINVGRTDLSGLSVAFEGANAADFTAQPLSATTLTPGQNINLSVRFTPAAAGSRSALLKISSNDADENTFDIFLTGTGLACMTTYNVTGGGSLCEGGAGLAVSLSGSTAGISYQLKKDGVNQGSALVGTGSALSFGSFTAAGQYTVTATQASCVVNMADTARVVVNTVTAGSIAADQSYCIATNASQLDDTLAASGQGTLTYQWQSGSNGTNDWTDIPQAAMAAYDPPILTTTTYFRRQAISTLNSLVCTTFSNVVAVVIGDVAPPTLSCPASLTRNAPGACSYSASGTEFNLLASNDNCGLATTTYVLSGATTGFGSNSLANKVFNNGNTTIQWMVTDNAGNRDSCSFVLTVAGAVPVVIDSCPASASVAVAVGSCVFTADSLLNPLVSGGCGEVTMSYTLQGINTGSGTSLSGYAFSPGQTSVYWQVADAIGNRDSCLFVLTVVDNQAPAISCPANRTIYLSGQSCNLTVNGTAFNPTSATDNCGPVTVSNNINQSASLAGTSLPLGSTTITWTASDTVGNTASCSLLVMVLDTIVPTINCQAIEVMFNGEDNMMLEASDLAEATDNCSISSLTASLTSISCEDIGTTLPVTVIAEDSAGNQTTCVTQLSVLGLPCGWNHDSDGIGCDGGSSISYDAVQETFTLGSNGCYYNTPFNSDELAFVSRSLCGDGSIEVRIDQLNGSGWAGLTLRDNDQPGARKIQLSITNQRNTVRREIRSTTNSAAVFGQVTRFNTHWLRIVRIGNMVIGYASANGSVWSQIGSITIPFGSCVEVGMVVSQNNPIDSLSVTFSNLRVVQQNYSNR